MKKININTAQNVFIEYETAGVGLRIVAFIIDSLIIMCMASVIFGVLYLITEKMSLNVGIWLNILLLMPFLLYNLLMELFFSGQSMGKMLFGIKVVKNDGSPLTFIDCFIRWVLRLIDIHISSGGIAVYSILFTEKHQRIGDLAAGTLVIKLPKNSGIDDLVGRTIENNYHIKFPEVEKLEDKTIRIIQDLLNRYRKEGPTEKVIDLSEKLSHKISVALEISNDRIEQLDGKYGKIKFLDEIVNDYNSIYGKI